MGAIGVAKMHPTVRGWCGAALALCAVLAAPRALPADVAVTHAPAIPRSTRRELDRAQQLLRERLSALPDGSGVVLRRDEDRITLRIPARLLFEPDTVVLRGDALLGVPLSATLRVLKNRHALVAQIEVYTDDIGGVAANQAFAQQRAQAIDSALGNAGIAPSRLQQRGAGAVAPLASNETPQGRMENRRVQIVFERAAARTAAAVRLKPAPATAP